MKKITLLLVLFSLNLYSQICLDCPKDTILKYLKKSDYIVSLNTDKDSITCVNLENDVVSSSTYLFRNDSCYKHIFVHNIYDYEIIYTSLNDTYGNEAFYNIWLMYNYETKKTELIYLVKTKSTITVIFEAFDKPELVFKKVSSIIKKREF